MAKILSQTDFPSDAIQSIMESNSFWIDSAPINPLPRLRANLKVDVLVIGGGVTGISAAYFLKQAGIDVALIERERVTSIDTGHTTAHLTYVTDTALRPLVKGFGRDHAQAVWDAGAAAIDEIERIIGEEEIECEFSRVPAFLHAPVFGERGDLDDAELKGEADLARELGFDADFVQTVPLFGVPGVRYSNQAEFHPLKYLGRLVETIARQKSKVFEHSAAE